MSAKTHSGPFSVMREMLARLMEFTALLARNNISDEDLFRTLRDKAEGRNLAGFIKARCPNFARMETHKLLREVTVPEISEMLIAKCFVGKSFSTDPHSCAKLETMGWPSERFAQTPPQRLRIYRVEDSLREDSTDPNDVFRDLLSFRRDLPHELFAPLAKIMRLTITLPQFHYLMVQQEQGSLNLEHGSMIFALVEGPDGELSVMDGSSEDEGVCTRIYDLKGCGDCTYHHAYAILPTLNLTV
ncbi:MAG TPA: hypothetical protein VG984_02355 [Candidatus Paceibacterota bacterium]|nr:hypothetical protein [Candidatus Paceibacterota bacterium]